MSTLGRNIAFPIYKGNGSSFHNLVIRKSTSDSVVMSLGDKVTGDVYYKDNTLVCDMDEYIMVDGVKYSIVNPPTIVREGLKSDNGDLKGMTKYSFEFYHPMYMLGNMAFSDVAVTNAESMFKSHDRTFSWIGNLTDFVAKLNKNLQDSQFIVSISSSINADSRNVLSDVLNFTNNTIADALKTAYDTWHFPFVVDVIKSGEQYYSQGKRFLIQFGNPTREILDANNQPFVFHFGKGVGLKNNSRTPRNNKIVTRVAGYGSEQNIPYGYPQIPWTGDPSATTTADGYPIYEGIVGGVVTKLVKHPFTRTHLMPSVYSESVRKKVNSAASDYDNTTPLVDYYDAPSSYPNPINLDAPRLDIVGIETIKPELGDMAILGATPVNDDLTPASGWDDTMDDDGNYLQSYFKITLPQLDFDIYACASITEEMKINMRSGACIGCTFDAQVDWDDYKKNFFDAQGNFLPNGEQRDLSKYPKSNNGSIDLIVKKDLNTYGMLMPNVYQQPAQGDKFVILGISMPSTYITNAEERLDAALMTHMLDNNVYYYDYPLKFDEDFFYNHTDILSQVRPNSVLRFTFGGEEKSLYIKQITIKYGEGVLPKYDITLTDNIEVVLNQIGLVADDVSRLALAMMQMNKRTNINISNTESLQKYVDYTIMPNLESIQRQIDGSQVTYFGNEDPFDASHPYSENKYVVDPTKFPASEWDDDYSEHDGDMFYNRETGKGYEFTIIDNSSSPVVYGWQLIQDEDIIQALNNAQTAQDTADGKRRVFICDASHHTPNPPYDVGDLWVNVKYPYSTGATYDDEILKCVVAKTEGQSFSINDWSLANGYTAALRNFINGTYANNLQEIQTQIDGKAETWYQNTDPSTAWTTTALKNQHKGDIWHNSSNATINGVKAGQDAIWNGTAWVVDETVPQAVYDEIDGKCAIYVSWGAWGNDLQEKDLFIPAADTTQGGITYKANKVYRCVDKDTPLFQEIAYTDDTQYNGFITKLIGSSGQTKDAAENAIAAIKHALNEGNTYNEGGLILSNLISLGTGNPTSGTFTPWAGISGIYKTSETGTGYKGHGIAAWFGGGMVDGEVSQSATNAAKSLFRFDGSGYVAGGNLSWDKNGNVTIQGYSINATTLQVGGSNVATESSISTFFANFFDIYNGSTQITYEQYVALQDKSNVSIKAKYGLWTEQFLSALGLNSQGGGGTGDVSAIRVSSTTLLQPTDGVIDMTNYVSTATQRSHWDAVYAKVPAATYNTGNELADKNFVNSSISTATAEYQGSKNLVSDLSLTTSATRTQIGTALGTAISGADNNDYCFVEIPTSDSDPTQIARVERYKYNGTSWSYEYTLNNSGFTSNQWSAINSGITSTHVTKLNGIAAGAQVNVLESVKINGTALSISSKAVNILTGNGLQSSTNTISIKLDTNSGLSVSSSGLKLDVVNSLDSTLTYKALSAAQGKSLNDRLAILESWFEVDADGNVKTKDKPNNGGHRGFYSESFVSALGSNSSGGGAGGGTVTGIIIGSGNPILPDSNGSVTIPAYPTSVTWANVTGKPSWIGSSKPTYSLSEISGTDDLQAIEGLTGTSGLLKKTAANTWTLDTNTYALASDVYSSSASRTKNYVLAAPSTANGAATFRKLVASDIPDLSSTYATDARADTLEGYFNTGGVAKVAAKLNTGTTTYTAWGQTYWSSGVPQNVSGHLYMNNNNFIYWKDNPSSGTATNMSILEFSSSNNLHLGYGSSGLGYPTYINGNVVYLRYGTSRTTGLFLNSDGNVGIGTTSPSYKLDVNGEVRGTAFRTTTTNGSYGTLNSRGSIYCYLDNYNSGFATGVYVVNSSGDTLGSAAGIYGSANAITRYYYGGTYDSPLMSILPSGKVGIGTTSPTSQLHVIANAQEWAFHSYNSASSSSFSSFYASYGNGSAGMWCGVSSTTSSASHYVAQFKSGITSEGSGGSVVMQINADGNVGIGTSSPSYKLHVNGYTSTTRLYLSSSVYLEYDSSKSGVHLVGAGFYSDSYVSALGANSSGGGGGGGTVTGIKLASNSSAIQPDANGIVTIPAATTSAFGVVKVGSTLSVSSGTINLKASGVTAGTYRSVTVDTYGRVTAGTNPTTLAGYGITDAYTKTASDGRFMRISDYTDIGATSSSTVSCNSLTTYGVYKNGSTSTASSYVTDRPVTSATPFRLVVERSSYASNPYIRQRYQSFDSNVAYERFSTDTGANWSDWVKVQDNLANYALASSLNNYLPLSGGTLTGTLTAPKIRINTRHSSGDTRGGIYYYNGTTDYLLIGQGSANLWIGANETDGTHHAGSTYISAGTGTVNVSRLVNGSRLNYMVLDTGNYSSYALPLTGGTLTGGLTAIGYNVKFDVDTSREIGLGWLNTSGTRVASVTYHNTEQNIILNPIGSANTYSDAVGKYSLFIGNNKLTYNTYTILHSNNTYVSSGKGYINGTEITTISGNAATASLLSYSHTNEINFKGGMQVNCYFNYRNADTNTEDGDTTAINYKFCNYTRATAYSTVTAGTFVGAFSGNATTATTLQTPRTIWGESFDGSANVSGAMTGVTSITMSSHIIMNNNTSVYIKDTNGTALRMLTVNNSNQYFLGFDAKNNGYNGYIDANNLYLRCTTALYLQTSLVTLDAGARISKGAASGSILYIGDTNNSGWVCLQDMCSQTGTGDTYWSIRNGGNAIFKEVTATSDERKKNILGDTTFSVKDIADTRSILFEWKDNTGLEKKVHGGSIAQDWLGKADWALTLGDDGYYSLNYGALALCSAITIAREVVKHDDEITWLKKVVVKQAEEIVELKNKVSELEERRVA